MESLERRALFSAPGTPDLLPASDTGAFADDNVTNLDNAKRRELQFSVSQTISGAVVTVYAGTTAIGSATAGGSTTLITTTGRFDLADGDHQITARQQSGGEPQSGGSSPLTITIDTTTPSVPGAPDLLASSDSGISATDNVTNDATPSFAVAAVPAAPYVRLFRAGTLVSELYASPASVTTVSPVPDGAANFTAAAVDLAGNVSATGVALSVTIDTKAWVPSGSPKPGTLDTAFGGDGIVTSPQPGGDAVEALLAQPDGKYVAIGGVNSGTLGVDPSTVGLARYLANGSLDPAFGTSGRVQTQVGYFDYATAAALQPDGKILVGGYTIPVANSGGSDFLLLRYHPDGMLDTTFGGGDGHVITQVGSGRNEMTSMVLLPDGKLLAAGEAFDRAPSGATSSVTALVRYNSDGSLDTTFGGGDGILLANTIPTSANGAAGEENLPVLALQPDGKIITTCFGADPDAPRFITSVSRFHPDGSPDLSFGGDGTVEYPVWDQSENHSTLAIHPDGRILVAGRAIHRDGWSEAFLMAVNPDGSLDATFGQAGVVLEPFNADGIHGGFNDLVVEPSGRILAIGHYIGGGFAYTQFAIARYLPNGSRDGSFGTGGVVIRNVDVGADGLNVGLLLPGSKLLVGGTVWTGFDDSTGDFALARYHLEAAPPPPDLQDASDAGPNATDNITADTTPSFAVTSPAGEYYRVYRDGVMVGGPYAQGTTLAAGLQPDGTWAYTLAVVDAAGNESARSAPLLVTIDSAAPQATITLPNDPPADFGKSATITFTEPVTGLDLADLRLTRDGGANLLTAEQTLTTIDGGTTWTLGNLAPLTGSSGAYELRLVAAGSNVRDAAGNEQGADASAVWLGPVGPTARAGGPYATAEGSGVPLDGTGSSDPNNDIALYEWDFDYDGATFQADATGAVPTLPGAGLDGPSSRTIALRVTDARGATSIDTASLTITNVAPTLRVAGPGRVDEGGAYTLTLGADDPGSDTIASWLIDWGDGSAPQPFDGADTTAEHVYTDGPAGHPITITATDEDGMYEHVLRSGQPDADLSFSGDGRVTESKSNVFLGTVAIVTQPGGRTVTLLDDANGESLMAYRDDGAVDTTFGNNGTIRLDNPAAHGQALAMLADGSLLFAGRVSIVGAAEGSLVVLKFTPDGQPDTSFGTGGSKTVATISHAVTVSGLHIDAAGRLLITGADLLGGTARRTIAFRTDAAGNLDPTFGTAGKATMSFGAEDTVLMKTDLDDQGRLVFAGYYGAYLSMSSRRVAVARLTTDGQLDASFSGDGYTLIDRTSPTYGEEALAVEALPDGKVLLSARTRESALLLASTLLRFTEAGAPDDAFGPGGKRLTTAPFAHRVYAFVSLADGSVLGAGQGNWERGTNEIIVTRYLPDGAPDPTFDADGYGAAAGHSFFLNVAHLAPDGKLLIGGYRFSPTSPSTASFAELLRLTYLTGPSVRVHDVPATFTRSGATSVRMNDPYVVHFDVTDPGDDPIAKWTIHWGDGAIEEFDGAARQATHTYTGSTGNRFVSIRATDEEGAIHTLPTLSVNVAQPAIPVPKINAPGASGEAQAFAVSGSGTLGEGTLTYEWDFDYDGATFNVDATGFTATATAIDGPAQQVVALRVTNTNGSAVATHTVDVFNLAPTVSASSPATASEGATYTLTLLPGADPGDDTISGWTIDWGDGDLQNIDGNPNSADHVYADGWAEHIIRAWARDEDGEYAAAITTPAAAPGTFDPQFGIDGKVTTAIGTGAGRILKLLRQPDGKLVAFGQEFNGAFLALTRYLPDGTLDATFGTAGRVTTDLGTAATYPQSAAVLPDGKILVLAEYNARLALVRYTASGALDTTFDGDGILLHTGQTFMSPRDMVVLPDGRLRVAGAHDIYSFSVISAFGLLADGSPDPSFGNNGLARLTLGGVYRLSNANDIAIDAAGRVVLAGAHNDAVVVMRLQPDGTLDSSFGGSAGHAAISRGNYDAATALLLQPDGKILVATESSEYVSNVYMNVSSVNRFNADGSIDTAFGSSGRRLMYNGSWGEHIEDLALDADGRIYAAGNSPTTVSPGFGRHQMAVIRLTPQGAFDTAFGTNARMKANFSTTETRTSNGYSMLLDGAHRLYVAGYADVPGNDFALARGFVGTPGLLTVENVAPTLNVQAPATAVAGDPVNIQFSATDPGEDTITSWLVDWGDGAIESFDGSATGATHTYAIGATRAVRVTATDEDGSYVSGPHNIVIDPPAPEVDGDGVLRIRGGDGADTIDVSVDGTDLAVLFNGAAYRFARAGVTLIDVQTFGAADALTLGAGVPTGTVDMGEQSALDVLTVGGVLMGGTPLAATLVGGQVILAPGTAAGLTLSSPATSVILTGTAGDDAWLLNNNRAAGAGTVVTWTGAASLRLDGLGGNDAFDVETAPSGESIRPNYTINGGGGNDTVRALVGLFSRPSPITISAGGLTFFGGDGDDTLATSAAVRGTLEYDGEAANDVLLFQGQDVAETYIVSDTMARRNDAANPHIWFAVVGAKRQFNTLPWDDARVYGNGGNDVLSIHTGTRPATLLDAGDGNDLFRFSVEGSTGHAWRQPVIVHGGGGADAVFIADSSTTTGYDYVVGATGAERVGDVRHTFEAVESVTLTGSAGPDVITVTPSDEVAFTINGGYPDAAATPADRLILDHAGATGATLTPSTAGAGTITFANRQSITFTGIEQPPELTSPTADIIDVTPDPRTDAVGEIQIVFSEPVTGFDLADLSLTMNGAVIELTSAQTLTTSDNVTWILGNLVNRNVGAGTYTLTLTAEGSGIADGDGNPLAGDASDTWTRHAAITARRLFYNNSYFDGNSSAVTDADASAIATDKTALLPGGTATFANYTSYSRAINGIVIDIAGLPAGAPLTAADFDFRVGNSADTSAWTAAPAPTAVAVRVNPVAEGLYRVFVTWADGAIARQWLRVMVIANTNTGLASDDVFYFGNAIGESGDNPANAIVNSTDEVGARNNPRTFLNRAPVDFRWDYNRDGLVNSTDAIIARNNGTTFLSALRLIMVPEISSSGSLTLAELSATSLQGQTLINTRSTKPFVGTKVLPQRLAPVPRLRGGGLFAASRIDVKTSERDLFTSRVWIPSGKEPVLAELFATSAIIIATGVETAS